MSPKRPPEPDDSNRYSALVSTLSLFIMLLAFFMMLNAKSNFQDDRVQPVLQSLRETFTKRVFRNDIGPSYAPDAEQGAGDGHEAYESLNSYFNTSFPGFTAQMIPVRGIFYIELPVEEFEKRFFGARPQLRKTLIEKMWAYQHLQMEIWLNLNEDPGKAASSERDQVKDKLKQLSDWARVLENDGLQKGALTIGLEKGDPKKVIVLFRNYKPYAPEP